MDSRKKSVNELLLVSARAGTVGTLTQAVADGADIDFQDKDGRTATMIAADMGRVACLSTLIDAGADLDARDQHGWTAAMWASFLLYVGPNRDCLNLLMKAGCSLKGLRNRGVDADEAVEAEHGRRLLLAVTPKRSSNATRRVRL